MANTKSCRDAGHRGVREAATLKGRPLQGEVCPSPGGGGEPPHFPPPPHPPPDGNGQLWSLQRGMCLPSAQHVPPPREARVRLPEDALPGQALQGGRGGCPPSPPHTLIRWGNCTEWMRKSNQHNRFPTILSHRGVREAATLKGRPLQGEVCPSPPPHFPPPEGNGQLWSLQRGMCLPSAQHVPPPREARVRPGSRPRGQGLPFTPTHPPPIPPSFPSLIGLPNIL